MNASTRNTMFVLAMILVAVVLSFAMPSVASAAPAMGGAADCWNQPADSTFLTPDNGLASCAAYLAGQIDEWGKSLVKAINTQTPWDRCMLANNDMWFCMWNSNKY